MKFDSRLAALLGPQPALGGAQGHIRLPEGIVICSGQRIVQFDQGIALLDQLCFPDKYPAHDAACQMLH